MTAYEFHKRIVKHYFCPTCGCEPFEVAASGKVVGINARSLDNFDLKNKSVQFFDGASS